jgi:CHAD domain-containing protein
MVYSLQENEPFSTAIKRIAAEQIDLALDHLTAASQDRDEPIHATRQSLKRVRALLVLARDELGGEVFEREWSCCRSAGRLLADGRDANVVVQTFDELIDRFSSELAGEAFHAERRLLAERRNTRLGVMIDEDQAVKKAHEMLSSMRERVESWPVKGRGFRSLRKGIRRSYRAGRRGLRSVVRHGSPTNFHEWRRPVKLLWHQLQIVTPIWPGILNANAEELRVLSNALNENHDLDVFRRTALWALFEGQPRDRHTLVALVDRRCRELEAEALPLGERLYTERPTPFALRIEGYWRAWERHSNDTTVSQAIIAIPAGRCVSGGLG